LLPRLAASHAQGLLRAIAQERADRSILAQAVAQWQQRPDPTILRWR